MDLYFDKNGIPIDVFEWSRLWSDMSYRRIGLTHVMDGATGEVKEVSTVWMGINYAMDGGLPLIFETMVFDGRIDERCERYSTVGAASEGHTAMVIEVSLEMTDPIAMEP